MTSAKTFAALMAGAAAVTLASAAQAQTPYNQTPYNPQQPQASSPSDTFNAILGALFGDRLGVSTSLDSEWSRGRRPLNTQRTQFQARLDADVRSGALTRASAQRFNDDYDDLVALEARYTSDGRVTTQERSDLAERYRAFSARFQAGGYDDGYGGDDRWVSLVDGRAAFDARVDAAVRARTLTRTEGTRLRADYSALTQLEATYQRGGVSTREQADLEARFQALEVRLGDNGGYGGEYGGGYGNQRMIASIEAGIASAERSGVNRLETERLRTELGDLTRLDAAYAQNGLDADESAYLTRRFGELDVRVRNTRR